MVTISETVNARLLFSDLIRLQNIFLLLLIQTQRKFVVYVFRPKVTVTYERGERSRTTFGDQYNVSYQHSSKILLVYIFRPLISIPYERSVKTFQTPGDRSIYMIDKGCKATFSTDTYKNKSLQTNFKLSVVVNVLKSNDRINTLHID